MALTKQYVTKQLNEVLCFLEPVQSLANSHVASFFSENAWSKLVPNAIQSELSSLSSVKNFIELYPKIIQNNCPSDFAKAHPNLLNFLNAAMNISITREGQYLKLLQDLEKLLSTKNCNKDCNIQVEDFMSPKKLHEVKRASKMTASISNVTQSSHIVDVGGGKGYLSCILALYYSYKVLGLDSSEVTTCGALKISEKIAKLWSGGIFKHPNDALSSQEVNNKRAREEFVQKHYKQIITFVSTDTNIEKLLGESFNEEITSITLTGLHTCGNLASTCLKLFLNSKKVRGIVNIGCCYNQISEEFVNNNLELKGETPGGNYGFPMSDFLRGKKYKLGRNARMLAAHSLDRINSNSDFEFSQTSIFYRAILETVTKNLDSPSGEVHVGRLARKCNNFQEYMYMAMQKLDIRAQLTENDLNKLYARYIEEKPFLTAFYLLRISLAPIVESIILLDRILYLIENGINNAYLVPLFNLEISPRGFGLIAWKDFDTR